MTHLRAPDKFNNFRWEVFVEDRHGAETAHAAFATEAEAIAQKTAWDAEMDRTGITIGARAASYER